MEFVMSAQERSVTAAQADAFNKALENSRQPDEALGRDEFLQILITQLQNQDPTSPMEDKQFIAQMAQFSTLEQMTNMSDGFATLASGLASGRAVSMLGKEVTIAFNGETVEGVVSAVTGGADPQIEVKGRQFSINDVQRIRQ
ncbi:MAG: flagellar hook assembly protein FlgD [Spirochaetaceae bacterium]